MQLLRKRVFSKDNNSQDDYSFDELKNKIVNELDTNFLKSFMNMSITKLELTSIVHLLEDKKKNLINIMNNDKNKKLFSIYAFINLSISIILIILTKILLIDNNSIVNYKAQSLRGYHIDEIQFKYFKFLGLVIEISIIFLTIISIYKISNLYPINYVLNNKIKKIKEIIVKIEEKINYDGV